MLHGSELRFSPFKLNFIPPCEDELWYASTPDAWRTLLRDADSSRWTDRDHNFLSMLKHFWKHAPNYEPSSYSGSSTDGARAKDAETMFPAFAFSRTSRMILYGIIAVAWDLRRRGDTRLLPFRPDVECRRAGDFSASNLSTHVQTSFQEWISWWASQTLSLSLKHVALTWWCVIKTIVSRDQKLTVMQSISAPSTLLPSKVLDRNCVYVCLAPGRSCCAILLT